MDKIRIKLKSFDKAVMQQVCRLVVDGVKSTGAFVRGPIRLPVKREVFTVLRSPHVNKKSREQFERRTSKCIIDIEDSNPQTIDSLGKLKLPAGIEISIDILN